MNIDSNVLDAVCKLKDIFNISAREALNMYKFLSSNGNKDIDWGDFYRKNCKIR